jgi:hypothetical protein
MEEHMSRRLVVHSLSLTGLGLALAMGACASPQIGNPCPIPDDATADQRAAALRGCLGQVGDSVVDARLKKDVDILFLIDNSPSMSPKQKALAQNIPKFIQKIDSTGANYHVGIATSDVGSDVMPGQPWGGNIGKCDTYEGDDGVLQAVACDTRTDVTSDAKNACNSLCPDDKFVPNDGHRYISKVDGVTNVPQAMELDPMTNKMVDRGPIHAFQCMALVGDSGCGIEGQLEGSKRALDGHRSENSGFLRQSSVLAVIYITDEDDCSVQLAKRDQNNPTTRDCDPTQPDSYDCYNVDYRCLARSIQCDQTMLTPGVKTNCKERPNNYLETLDKYYKFFSTLRPSNKLLISGIWTLPSIFNGGHLEIAKGSGGPSTPYLNRAPGMGASCTYSMDQTIFGQAQYRLSNFAKLFGTESDGTPSALEVSICDIDNYPTALDKIAKAITNKLSASCLPVTPKLNNGSPLCLVGDVDENSPDSSPDVDFPVCSSKCCDAWANSTMPTPTDPNIVAACTAESADCYCAVKSTVGQCPGTVVAGVWRKGNQMPPPGKVVNFRCAGGG